MSKRGYKKRMAFWDTLLQIKLEEHSKSIRISFANVNIIFEISVFFVLPGPDRASFGLGLPVKPAMTLERQ